jgi:outer membrane protein assembly factor BamB
MFIKRSNLKFLNKTLWVFAVILLTNLTGCLASDMKPTATTCPIFEHQPESVTKLELKWSLKNAYLDWNRFAPVIGAAGNKTCFLGDLEPTIEYRHLVCIDSQQGTILWNIKTKARHLDVDKDGIFVGYASGGAVINKFDFESGAYLWRREIDGTGILYLNYVNGSIQALTPQDNFIIVDMNGKVVQTIKNERIYGVMPEAIYLSDHGFRALEPGTNKVLWISEDFKGEQHPLFASEETIFIRDLDEIGRIYAVNRKTGQRRWETDQDDIFSNLVYSPSNQVIYALRTNGDLVSFDEFNGQEERMAHFANLSMCDLNKLYGYQLAYDADEQILVVSLGDSDQLFAFAEK